MKKIVLSVLVIFVTVLFFNTNTVYAKTNDYEREQFVQKDKFEEGFETDKVLVVLSNEESKKLKEYTKDDFEEIDVEYIQDLSIDLVNLYREFEVGNYSMIEDNNDIRLRLDIDSFHQVLAIHLRNKSKESVLETISILKEREEILCAEPDYLQNSFKSTNWNDPYFDSYVPSSIYVGKWALNKISASNMWNITTGNKKVKVGILDGAVDKNHEDLTYNMSSLSRKFGHGYAEAFSMSVLSEHATGIAGIIGAEVNNSKGIAGVCWDVSLVSLDIKKDSGDYDYSTVVPAITYATANNIQILNMSLDCGDTPFLKAAVLNYPGLIVCAAGNENSSSIGFNYPILWDFDNVISVGASKADDNKENDSNYSSTLVHLFAPGITLQSTNPYNLCASGSCYQDEHLVNGYHLIGGTSFAAPFVAGVAALMLSVNPRLTAVEVKELILNNVDDVSQLHGLCSSGGRLNGYKAVRAATESATFIKDVNGDGRDDMILIRQLNDKYAFSVYEGYTTGYLSSPTTTTTTRTFSYDEEPLCGDFNGDGKADILLHYAVNSYRHFSIFLGQSNGTFSSETQISSTRYHDELLYPYKAFIGDHDGDGKDDFILLYENGSYNVGILVYKGTSLNPYLLDALATYSSNISFRHNEDKLIGDFNGDGMTDIVIQSKTDVDNYIILYAFISEGNSYFTYVLLYSSMIINIETPYKLLIGDQNGDGKDDLIIHYKDSYGYRAAIVYKGKNTGSYFDDATFISLSSYNNYISTDLVYSGDFTGDGCCDMLVEWNSSGYRSLLTYRGRTNGYYYSGVNQDTSNGYNKKTWPAHSYVGDIDGDGADDFIVKWKYAGDDEVSVHVYLGGYPNGTNIFSTAKTTHSYIPFYNE